MYKTLSKSAAKRCLLNILSFMLGTEENWYALRTFFSQEQKVGEHLKNYDVSWFIPMRGLIKKTKHGERNVKKDKNDLPYQPKPFVHNLIFIKQPDDVQQLTKALKECPYSTRMYCKADSPEWYVIPGRDILELRIICDQTFTDPIFLLQGQDEIKVGREVRVVHGPLSGIHGRMVRKNKKYYVIKTVTNGLSVMVAVSRWCCEPLDSHDNNADE